MQVNNSTSPSFRALIIEQGARNSLKECNMSQLTKVQEAGNLLKDTKFYNVRIDEKLKCHSNYYSINICKTFKKFSQI